MSSMHAMIEDCMDSHQHAQARAHASSQPQGHSIPDNTQYINMNIYIYIYNFMLGVRSECKQIRCHSESIDMDSPHLT